MTEQEAPVQGRVLPLRRGGTEPGTGSGSAAPEGGSGAGPVPPPALAAVPGAGVPMSAVERAAGAALNAARELWFRPGRLFHSFVRPEPETMKEHWAHVQSRAWVPGEMTGTPEKVITALGLFHHLLVAYPVKAAAKAAKFTAEKVDEAADRPLRLYGLGAFFAILLVLLFVL